MSFDFNAVMFAVLCVSVLLNVWWGRHWLGYKSRRWSKAWWIFRS